MAQIGHQIFSIPPDLDYNVTLPDDEKEHYGNFQEAFEKFYIRSNMKSIYRLPNFQFGGWEDPSGWVASFPPQAGFKQHAFNYKKYDVFTMVKLKIEGSDLTPARLQEIQRRETTFLNRKSVTPPGLESTPQDGWGVALDGGGFIMICKTKVKDENELREVFYAVCYSCLPKDFLDIQQDREVKLQKSTDDFFSQAGTRGKVQTFEKEFLSNLDNGGEGYQARAQKIGQEIGKRILSDWSRIVKIKLDVDEVVFPDAETQDFVTPGDPTSCPPPQLLEQALQTFKGGFIRPYSVIPSDLEEIPKNLHGYEIGKALSILQKEKPAAFIDFQTKYQFQFSPDIVTFTPDCQTVVNGFSVSGVNHLTWYCNCCPMEGAPFLFFKGYQEGFECFNYNPIKRNAYDEQFKQRNNYFNAFPCLFPFRKHFKELTKETILKFCSPGRGGYLYPHKQPGALLGEFINTDFSQSLFNPPQEKITLEPVHVFLSGEEGLNDPIFSKNI
jgi:hypothetical protein